MRPPFLSPFFSMISDSPSRRQSREPGLPPPSRRRLYPAGGAFTVATTHLGVLKTLARIGIDFNPPKGTFYLWVPTPKGMSSIDFTNRLFEKAAVVVAAGTAYGQYGEGFIRISLTVPDARLEEAMARIEAAF